MSRNVQSDPKKLLQKNRNLIHSERQKVVSHVQRDDDDWIINTVMIESCDLPFRFKRKKQYQNLTGSRVNLTYYPGSEKVAGISIEIMHVVRLKIS